MQGLIVLIMLVMCILMDVWWCRRKGPNWAYYTIIIPGQLIGGLVVLAIYRYGHVRWW